MRIYIDRHKYDINKYNCNIIIDLMVIVSKSPEVWFLWSFVLEVVDFSAIWFWCLVIFVKFGLQKSNSIIYWLIFE